MEINTHTREHCQNLLLSVPCGQLRAFLVEPSEAKGLVVFAHGTEAARHSPRNRRLAERLSQAGIASLLVTLLTEEEEKFDVAGGGLRYSVPFLAERLAMVVELALAMPAAAGRSIGLFGGSTGGAPALMVAASHPAQIAAVVCRGGRPDEVGSLLEEVKAPTLLVVGERDQGVLWLNRHELEHLECIKALEVVPGADRHFYAPKAIEILSDLTASWFRRYLLEQTEDS